MLCRTYLILLACCRILSAAEVAALEELPAFRAAQQALADGLPEVAAVKAERLLEGRSLATTFRQQVATFAAEAWTRAGKPAQVFALAEAQELHEEYFWLAQAHALRGHLAEAREELTSGNPVLSPAGSLLLGQVLASLGERDAARDEIGPLLVHELANIRRHARLLLAEIEISAGKIRAALDLLDHGRDPDDATAELIRARCLLLSAKFTEARETLEKVLSLSTGGERARHAAGVLLAEVWLQENHPEKAIAHLVRMLDGTVSSEWWIPAFDMLDRAWMAQADPRVIPEVITRWATQGSQAQQTPEASPVLEQASGEFRGHAEFILAKWLRAEKRPVEAAGLLEGFFQLHPDHPRLSAALRIAMEIYAGLKADLRVLQLTETWRDRFSGEDGGTLVDFLAGSIQYRRGDFGPAQESFEAAANVAGSLSERRRSLFNAAVSALKGGEMVLYLGLLAQLEAAGGSQDVAGDSAADLLLEKALEAAAQRHDDGEESLRTFITKRPWHPRLAEAQLALVEWLLQSQPPKADEARKIVEAVRLPEEASEARDKLAQRLDHTRLWMREISGDLKTLITDCAAFAKAWPKSPLLPEVRMKEAGAHFQLEDFASARTSFEIIAKEHAQSPQADTALYFAALSAMSVMSAEGRERALAIWDDLAKKGGSLAIASRRQQALAYRRQADLTSALKALDQILAMKQLDADMRNLTLCEKAEVLLLQGKKDRQSLEVAAKLLRDFLQQDGQLSFLWKARAGFTLATVLHEADSDAEALEACYDTLRAADTAPPSNPADYLWFSKAGFYGVELLENAHQWEAAAKLAEQIAQVKGSRANDARQIATKIRLEHFLWDGPKPTPPVQPALPAIPVTDEPAPAKKGTTKKKN
ncbi:MAG: outer membrane protein assembly factor BamD [Verrucomicrobiota bacterium]